MLSWLLKELEPVSEDDISLLQANVSKLQEAADEAVENEEKPSGAIIRKSKEILGRS